MKSRMVTMGGRSMKELTRIENIIDYIDDDKLALDDLRNAQEAVLVFKGNKVFPGIYKMAVFVQTLMVRKEYLALNDAQESVSPSPSPKKDLFISEEYIFKYWSIKKKFKDVFDSPYLTLESYRILEELVEELFLSKRDELIRAIWILRNNDDCVYNHSISVSLFYLEALSDLKKHSHEVDFFNSIKNMGEKIHFNSASLKRYAMGALLHDYGKTSIEDSILNKPDPLTKGEFDLIRLHPYYGIRALKAIGVSSPDILDIVGNHHFHYRVNSSPQSPAAQICNIIDIYDACRFNRSYKKGFSFEKTQEILRKESLHTGWDSFIFKVIYNETLVRLEDRIQEFRMA